MQYLSVSRRMPTLQTVATERGSLCCYSPRNCLRLTVLPGGSLVSSRKETFQMGQPLRAAGNMLSALSFQDKGCQIWVLKIPHAWKEKCNRNTVFKFITYRAKMLNADWIRRRAFFLNFPSMEGKITRSWLAERQNLLAPDWSNAPFLHLVGFLKCFAQNFLPHDRFKFWLLSRLMPLKSKKIRR